MCSFHAGFNEYMRESKQTTRRIQFEMLKPPEVSEDS